MIIGIDASRALIKERTGTENYAYHLIQALLEVDQKNEYVLYTRGSHSSEVAKQRLRLLRGGTTIKAIPWSYFWTQGGLALECLLRPPDLLFIPSHTLPLVRRPSLKTVVTIHGLEYEYLPQYYQFPQKLYLTKSTEYAVRYATRLIAVSQWTKDQLVSQLNADPKKISVVHEGINVVPPRRSPASSAGHHPRSDCRQYILFVGTVQPRKNLVRLIESFKLAMKQLNNETMKLLIAGKLGWLYDEILAAPRKFGVEKRVKFLGYVDDRQLAGLYHQALFFILPSLCEGFGLPVLEAMAYGCPIIAARAGALPEIVGQAGLLVNPKNTDEIAAAMKLMIENQDLREALREKGFQRVKQFSWQKAAQKTVKIFKEVYES